MVKEQETAELDQKVMWCQVIACHIGKNIIPYFSENGFDFHWLTPFEKNKVITNDHEISAFMNNNFRDKAKHLKFHQKMVEITEPFHFLHHVFNHNDVFIGSIQPNFTAKITQASIA